MTNKILVTGGAGFIGSHLCERLIAGGHDVLCVDNYFTGSKKNVEHLLSHPLFEMMRHDVTFPLYVEVERIFNLACPASPVHYQFDPVQTTKTSVHGAINMLGLAKRVKARILQASTSEVYGDPEVHPQPESYWGKVNPIGIRSCYDEGKRCAETLFFDYHRQHGVDIKVIRIFNTYGPRMNPNDGRVVSNFIVQALRGEDITIYGDGQQTRSFCYVDDLVEGMLRMMDSDGNFHGPVNIGNPGEFTMLQLAEKVLGAGRSQVQARAQAAAARRPEAAQADHRARQAEARRLGAEGELGRRPERDRRLLPQSRRDLSRSAPRAPLQARVERIVLVVALALGLAWPCPWAGRSASSTDRWRRSAALDRVISEAGFCGAGAGFSTAAFVSCRRSRRLRFGCGRGGCRLGLHEARGRTHGRRHRGAVRRGRGCGVVLSFPARATRARPREASRPRRGRSAGCRRSCADLGADGRLVARACFERRHARPRSVPRPAPCRTLARPARFRNERRARLDVRRVRHHAGSHSGTR